MFGFLLATLENQFICAARLLQPKKPMGSLNVPILASTLALSITSKKGCVLEPKKLFAEILGWSDEFLVEGDAIPDPLRVPLEGG